MGRKDGPRPSLSLGQSCLRASAGTHVSFVGREFPVFSQNTFDQNNLPPERSYASVISKVSVAAGAPTVYVLACPPTVECCSHTIHLAWLPSLPNFSLLVHM